MSLLAACSLVMFVAAAPQQPATIEVIGPASPPSGALRTQVEKGEDEFLLFDVGYGVHQAVSDLHTAWAFAESRRATSMGSALSAIHARCEGRDDAAATACASVAAVALALLQSLDRSTLTRRSATRCATSRPRGRARCASCRKRAT